MSEYDEVHLAVLAGDFDFPVAPYLRGQIKDALTLTSTGDWWKCRSSYRGSEESQGVRGYIPLAA